MDETQTPQETTEAPVEAVAEDVQSNDSAVETETVPEEEIVEPEQV